MNTLNRNAVSASLATVAAVVSILAVQGTALANQPTPRAVIPFAALGGIRDWHADGDQGFYVEGTNGKWFHATFFGTCNDIRFVDHIGFVTEPVTGELDKFSSIFVNGNQCSFRSFEPSAAPAKASTPKAPS